MTVVLLKDQKRTIGEASIDSKLIHAELAKTVPGDVVTYSAMSAILGRNILRNRSCLTTARNKARNEDGMVFDCVMGVGLKRLNNSEIVDKTATQPFRRIGAVLRKTKKDIKCIDAKKITNAELIRLNATQSVVGALELFSRPKAAALVERNANEPLPIAKTLALFQTNYGAEPVPSTS